jgi:hypothetical protein
MPDESSPTSVFADWWGDEPSPRTAQTFAAAPFDQWVAFSQIYRERRLSGEAEQSAVPPGAPFCSIDSPADQLYDATDIPLGATRIRALALYARAVVVRDPLERLTQTFLDASTTGVQEPPGRRELEGALSSLAELLPLERESSLLYRLSVPVGQSTTPSFLAAMLSGPQLVTEGLDWRWMSDPRGVKGDASPGLAALNIVSDVAQARRLAPDGSIFIGTPLERSVLAQLFTIGTPFFHERSRLMYDLATLPVPVLVPSTRNVVLVRSADEYVQFRSDLSRALGLVSSIPDTDESWLGKARSVVADELSLSARRLERSLAKSPALRSFKQVASGLSLSALGAVTGSAVGGAPVPAITSAAVTAIGNALAAFLSTRKGAKSGAAVLESYMMFGSPPLPR